MSNATAEPETIETLIDEIARYLAAIDALRAEVGHDPTWRPESEEGDRS